jgi:indolepyruvate ferredoxin oxidoreductase
VDAVKKEISSKDVYAKTEGKVFMTGIQALVRLPMIQRVIDRACGLNTAGLVSGYRGSPLGAYDQQLWKASKELAAHDVIFQPGLNEDLAATALWGAQMHAAFGETTKEGVFGIWYGKGPGVDRTGDVFRTANVLGTSKLGGVLAVSGDDHAAQSSMYPHQTDGIFQSASMPVLQPANVREILELGLAGIAMSRFSGLWVGLKTIAEVIETAATIDIGGMPAFRNPDDFPVPAHGLNWDPRIAWPGQRSELERRLIEERLPAARAWARANKLDKTIHASSTRRFGIVTVGKAHQDLMQAMSDLGLGKADLDAMGISIYKVAMSWPLETAGMLSFAEGHEELFIVEEKRSIVETQVKEALYHRPASSRPIVTGKTDVTGAVLLPEVSEFTPLLVARALVRRLEISYPEVRARLAALESRQKPVRSGVIPIRRPYFCSGCPHNSSTRTPDGSVTGGGIGCHVMALSQPELKTKTFSQMGGEGAQWIGASPFSATRHIFQNLGDGTYQHSGLLAIRAAVAANANITYKILYNDAVAMTGGQTAEGAPDPMRIVRQLLAEGVGRVVLVSDRPEYWQGKRDILTDVGIYPREELDAVQRELREMKGVTAIVYEQTCAAEKRRRRKRGDFPDPDKRLFINDRVCEGCGDCSVQSNCIAVEPMETAFGRKRKINQSSCNKDFSCVKGFCPSFVEVAGVKVRRPDDARLKSIEAEIVPSLPIPHVPSLPAAAPFNILVTGIGGTGVLTMGALLGGAAHLEGKGATVLDFTGLAQKNGAVISQVKLASSAEHIHAVRIGVADTDLLFGADLVVASGTDVLTRIVPERAGGIVNTGETPTADVVANRDASLPTDLMFGKVRERCDAGRFHALNANELAQRLFGDTVTAHTLMLGYAWQKGLIPLGAEAIERAIELNGAAVALNKRAFVWGRIAAARPEILARVHDTGRKEAVVPQSTEALIKFHADELAAYQDADYALRYSALMSRVYMAEARAMPGKNVFTRAVASSAFKLMAYKDEYEIARLYSSDEFLAKLGAQFSDMGSVSVWLAPPMISKIDPATGRPKKRKFGPWVFTAFKVLSRMKRLRGTPFDVFGYTRERRQERRLMEDFLSMVEALCDSLNAENYDVATELAGLPNDIRGYGPVKELAVEKYEGRRSELWNRFLNRQYKRAA